MTADKQIIAGDYLLTMDAGNRVIPQGAVLIDGGKIEAVGPLAELTAYGPDVPVRKIDNSVVMPGLVNAHAHSGFLRGTAEHLPVWDWLTLHINPMHRVLNAEEAEVASQLC